MEEPRRKRRGLLPSPFGLVLSSGASSAFIPWPLPPSHCLPQLQAPVGGGGVEKADRTQCPYPIPRPLSLSLHCHAEMGNSGGLKPSASKAGTNQGTPIALAFSFAPCGAGSHPFSYSSPQPRSPVPLLQPCGWMVGRSRAVLGGTGSERVGVGEFGDWAVTDLFCLPHKPARPGHPLRPPGPSGCRSALRMTDWCHRVGARGWG